MTHIFQTSELLIKYEYKLVFDILIIFNFLSCLIKCNTILTDSNIWCNDDNNLSFLYKFENDQIRQNCILVKHDIKIIEYNIIIIVFTFWILTSFSVI